MTEIERLKKELEEIKQELAAQVEGSRAYKFLEREKAEVEAQLIGSGALAQGDGATAIGQDGINIGGGMKESNFIKGDGNQVIQNSNVTIVISADGQTKEYTGEQPVEMKPELRNKALGRYLEHVIAHNRYLQLQGIRSGGKLVNIELEQIYITLRTTQQRTMQAEEEWLRQEAEFAPGEIHKRMDRLATETVNVRVEQALAAHKHIVVLGDPGSGKTTLLRYLTLLYGRDLAQGLTFIKDKLALDESGHLPILLQLRQIGAFLKAHHPKDDGTEGCGLLLDFLFQSLKNQKLELSSNFFDSYLESGKAILLLDGMDEVADPDLRARVARLVESFTLAYPSCRFVVTSRVVGYSGPARLQADYVTTTVRDFALDDVRQFLKHWHRLVAIGQMGAGEDAENYAASQTNQLLSAIENNERVRDLAINPLMLTVIALAHRDRVKLPDRRAELYAEAVDVLLGKWDEARGVDEIHILDDRPFDAGDRRLLLQNIALYMHEREKKELEAAELRTLLQATFKGMTRDESEARRAAERFLTVVEERTGLLSARGEGVYAFSHLTFQEYLAALAIAARDDYVDYVLQNSDKAWWREVILLTAGFLSTQSKERTTKLIRCIAENKAENYPYYNLALAIECIQDIENRVDTNLVKYIKMTAWKKLQEPIPEITREPLRYIKNLPNYFDFFSKTKKHIKYAPAVKRNMDSIIDDILDPLFTKRLWLEYRASFATDLIQVGIGHWTFPFGEPEWVTIPEGEFWMGNEGSQENKNVFRKVFLPEYKVSLTPITNYQYQIFERNSGYISQTTAKKYYGKEMLARVAIVSAVDAVNYCQWLSEKTGKNILLPSESEWEKAARGDVDQRTYPWGEWENARCNSQELGLFSPLPVGILPEGSSPYGVMDMVGNETEWTRTYEYSTEAEFTFAAQTSGAWLILKGGQFVDKKNDVRISFRDNCLAYDGWFSFRVVNKL